MRRPGGMVYLQRMPKREAGCDCWFGKKRYFSVHTKERDDGRRDWFLFAADNTDFHAWTEAPDGSRRELGAQAKSRGVHVLEEARIESTRSFAGQELGRVAVDPASRKCEFAVTHGGSATSTSATSALQPGQRVRFDLPGYPSKPATWHIEIWEEKPPPEAPERRSLQLFSGARPLYLGFAGDALSSTSGGDEQ